MQLQPNSTLQGGRYKILKTLGQGGFGITYLAVQSGLEREVAIKEFFMKELCDREESTSHVTLGTAGVRETVNRFKEKFLKEARNIAGLSHPNIVKVMDVFEENGTAYYVMEYLSKGSLGQLVKNKGPLSETEAQKYVGQIASALQYIHKRQMNHLDVKPANIMLNDAGDSVLVDFGLAKQYDVMSGQQTSSTPVGISEGFAPLEQYKQGGVSQFSPECDVYALGATYYNLLTGNVPPSASDVNENGIPIEPLKVRGVSKSTIAAIESAMQPRRRERMQDVMALVGQAATAPQKDKKTNRRSEDTVVAVFSKPEEVGKKGLKSKLKKPINKQVVVIAAELAAIVGVVIWICSLIFGPKYTIVAQNKEHLQSIIKERMNELGPIAI